MLSRRNLSALTFAALTLVVMIVTSKGVSSWSGYEAPYYYRKPNVSNQTPVTPTPDTSGDLPGARLNVTESVDAPPAPPVNHDFPFRPSPKSDPLCESFPDTTGILLVMKTGASESFHKLPTQLMTVLRCLPDFLLFSDMEQHIAGYRVHDTLETVLAEAKDGNPDFDLYRRQRACAVDQTNCNKLGDPSSEGWNLDKYKNVHMAEKAYQMKPGYDWYVFVDADTYVLWPNLVQWLGKLNARKKMYFGSVAMVNGFNFGHGGSGYVLSKAAMQNFAGDHPGVANKYDVMIKNECCGDYVFARAMKEVSNIVVQNAWPTINGEKPSTFPFGDSHWCQPLVTMHHMDSEEVSAFWEFERRRYGSSMSSADASPLLLRDVFHEFFVPRLEKKREDWDNLADHRYYLDLEDPKYEKWQRERVWDVNAYTEPEKVAHLSAENCAAMCESLPAKECFQWKYHDGVCSTGNAISLGKPVKEEDGKATMSGWDVQKILDWASKRSDCPKIAWPLIA